MVTHGDYPFRHHPCFSNSRDSLWHRIHLPVAAVCNVKCAFCSHSVGSACHTSKPGFSRQLMTPEVAVTTTRAEIEKNPLLRIVAISGPGEPLANPETFETLEMIRDQFEHIAMCISSNGTLLEKNVDWLKRINVQTVTVSMSTANIQTAAAIYEWARFGNQVLRNEKMGSRIIEAQLRGISNAAKAGIQVKVNSILIPSMNMQDIVPLAKVVAKAGAAIQNIVPLVPSDNLSHERPPTMKELLDTRELASKFIMQFSHCKQCRSDVVGIPGCDRVL